MRLRMAWIAAWLLMPLMAASLRADESKPGEWVLIDRRGAARVYNLYETTETKVPKYRIEGVLEVPHDAAVEIIWDAGYEYPHFISDWLITARRISPTNEPRRDLYVYEVPRFARIAVRLGSVFRGTLGRHQYTTLELEKSVTNGFTRIDWKNVPTPKSAKPELKRSYEIGRNSGYWVLRPIATNYTRYTYMLDAYPGGSNIPAPLIRWGNKMALGFGPTIEARYRDLKEAGRY